ncbi:MAG: glycosyltransferase family 2 protein [Gammaproteobacteria bacterium]
MTARPAPARIAPAVGVVVPCYRERDHVLAVLAAMPPLVTRIYCIDDGCPQHTGDFVRAECGDPRVSVVYHGHNQGVGAAMRTGYRAALADGMDVVAKVDGDGQMDPADIPRLLAPILADAADYTKGNRFYRLEGLADMPWVRLAGNTVLSFVSKLSTGYWQSFDPNNGFTAIDARVLALLPLERIDDGYFFESDMLFRLNTLRAVVQDIPMRARYGDEQSSIRLPRVTATFAARHTVNFFKRLFYNYFLRGFSVASVEWILGPLLLGFGIVFGLTQWAHSVTSGTAATAGTVMLASLPTIVGMQMLLSAIHFDIGNEPSVPLRRLLDGGIGPAGRR